MVLKDDPLNIVELIRQAKEVQRAWKLPPSHSDRPLSQKPWQQLMADRLVKPGWGN